MKKRPQDLFQEQLFDEVGATETARSLLDQLLSDSRLYRSGQEYKNLLDYVVRMRNFAPFNGMLLQIQKPGLMYAASARDWRERFDRRPRQDARPLLILWPFGPVALVYDVQDTEGKALPEGVNAFAATGQMTTDRMHGFISALQRKNIVGHWFDGGEGKAGYVKTKTKTVSPATDQQTVNQYQIGINRNHNAAVQFATLAHELGHLFLGHLGSDKHLKIPDRSSKTHAEEEIEAESVAYLVCNRNGVRPKSERYLSEYVSEGIGIESLDVYRIMQVAGQVETLLGLGAHTKFDRR